MGRPAGVHVLRSRQRKLWSVTGGAAIIHFTGGIHEIYFPYVLMNPRLITSLSWRYDWRIHPDHPERRSGFSGFSVDSGTGDDAKRRC